MTTTIPPMNALWMPFTANRQFKAEPRLLVSAQGMWYQRQDGTPVLDGTAGLWCTNAGHGRAQIADAVSAQLRELDYAPPFQMCHPKAFELAERLAQLAPDPLNHVFFTNSGSESADTALKIALAYQRARGEPQRTRLIGREKGYHGTNFGGISVGGMGNNRRAFALQLPGVDHLPHTMVPEAKFSRGMPEHGAHLADRLEELLALHGPENIAAVMVEPMSGSGGVVVPPIGYLERLREITRAHGIVLIFDEVITGFGRVGSAFAANQLGVVPDLITCAKGLTNGAIPMGAVIVDSAIHDAFMHGPQEAIELFHGYTYSGHPVAAAAGLATLDIYRDEQLFDRALELGSYWEDALHSLRELPNVVDIRNMGLVGAVELAADGTPGARGYRVYHHCFWHNNTLVRCSLDTIALSPPLIISKAEIDQLMAALKSSILAAA